MTSNLNFDFSELVARGLIEEPLHYADNFATTRLLRGTWTSLALSVSSVMVGNVWVSSTGITVARGRNTFFLQSHEVALDVLSAREIAVNLGLSNAGYSIGNIARKLLEWTARREAKGSDYTELRHGSHWGYLHAVPSIYSDAREWDVRSCYYELFKRLPSLRMTFYNGILGRVPLSSDEMARKRDLCAAIGEHKPLRNNLVGCMTGTVEKTIKVAIAGKWERRALGGGAFPTAGYLIVRSGFEMCQEAAHESNAVHAATDGIIEASGVRPKVWQRCGLETRLKAQGEADIRSWGAYKIGEKQTDFYTDRIRHAVEMPAPTVPSVLYYKSWLL